MPLGDEDLRTIWKTETATQSKVDIHDLERAQVKLDRRVRFRNVREYVTAALFAAAVGYHALRTPMVAMKVACVAMCAATMYVVLRLRRYGAALAPRAPDAALIDHIAHHRASLVRQRDLLRSVWRWYLGPIGGALLAFYAAVAVELAQSLPFAAILGRIALPAVISVLVLLAVGWANHRSAKKIDEKLAMLEAR